MAIKKKTVLGLIGVSALVLALAAGFSRTNQSNTPETTPNTVQTSTSSNQANSQSSEQEPASSSSQSQATREESTMQLRINDQEISVNWADNPTVTTLLEQVRQSPIELTVRDYGGMEKVGDLPTTLPSSNQQMSTDAGDITLFNGRSLAFYYDRNNYSLTPIGTIHGMSRSDIRQLLTSQAETTISISLAE